MLGHVTTLPTDATASQRHQIATGRHQPVAEIAFSTTRSSETLGSSSSTPEADGVEA